MSYYTLHPYWLVVQAVVFLHRASFQTACRWLHCILRAFCETHECFFPKKKKGLGLNNCFTTVVQQSSKIDLFICKWWYRSYYLIHFSSVRLESFKCCINMKAFIRIYPGNFFYSIYTKLTLMLLLDFRWCLCGMWS